MISTRWLKQRRPHWQRLESLVDQISKQGLASLTRAELQELGLLYRQIATDLSAVREHPASSQAAEYLNRLLARAHHIIYAAKRPNALAAVKSFATGYPKLFRRNAVSCAAAFCIFLGGMAVGAAVTLHDPEFKTSILSPAMIDSIDRHEMWTHSILGIKPTASSQIMTNNMTVSLTAFASGITVVGPIYMLAFNGLLIGVLSVVCAASGMSLALWSFVAPHGALELPAIFIAGGAGLRLAGGLLFPGVLPRRESLVRAGREAARLALGCLPILVVAGVIEAFVSPTDLPVALKFAVSGALLTLLSAALFAG